MTASPDPVVLRQPAGPGFAFMLAGVLVLVGCLWLNGKGLALPGAAGLVVGGAGALLGARMALRPNTLTLAPDGLAFVNLGIRRAWRWNEVSGFQLTHVRSATVITFRDHGGKAGPAGRLYSLPARWTVPAQTVIDTLNAAQARWG